MLNREELFAAIGEIDDELVLPVLERLEGERERPRLRVTRKAIRVALIAAVIAALLAVTAMASEILGLKSRLVSSETGVESADPRLPVRRDHISLNGLAGSREYLACSEWLSFCDYYEEQMAGDCLADGKEAEAWKDSFHSFAGNQAEKDITVSSMASFESYCNEIKLDYSVNAFTALAANTDRQQMDGSIAPGSSLSGYLCLEVPTDWMNLEIHYTDQVWKDEGVVFKISK